MRRLILLGFMAAAAGMLAQQPEPACSMCAVWNTPEKPFRIYGNTYYVGTHGLTSVLIVSDQGDILIDGALRESAPLIAANIKALGFRLEDVKLIVSSHVHHDHAGGVAELQRMTGARVLASPWSAAVLKAGGVGKDDPQYGDIRGVSPVANVGTLTFEEPVRVGSLALTPHSTPGHTPGGTSWTWQSCEGTRCLSMVYADSVTPVSAPGFLFTKNAVYPDAIADFEKSYSFLDSVPCDILITPHPEAAQVLVYAETRGNPTKPNGIMDGGACRRLAATGRKQLAERLAKEQGK